MVLFLYMYDFLGLLKSLCHHKFSCMKGKAVQVFHSCQNLTQ